MPTLQLSFVVNCGVLGVDDHAAVLALIDENPFGRVTHWLDDADDENLERQPYARERLAALLRKGPTFDLTAFLHADERLVEIGCRQTSQGATFSVTVASPELERRHGEFLDHARAWVSALPKVSSGRIGDGNADWPGLYAQLQLAQPPACFTLHLRWVHYLGPGYYSLFLTREELLGAPAHRVTSLAEGVIELVVYPDPFAWRSAAAGRALVELTDYLNAHDRFMKE